MSEASGNLQVDPVFLGLTRPTMILGVNYLFFVLNAMINLIVFINTRSFAGPLLVAPAVHLVAYLICLTEPRALELLITRYSLCSKCRNRVYHKFTNSYDM